MTATLGAGRIGGRRAVGGRRCNDYGSDDRQRAASTPPSRRTDGRRRSRARRFGGAATAQRTGAGVGAEPCGFWFPRHAVEGRQRVPRPGLKSSSLAPSEDRPSRRSALVFWLTRPLRGRLGLSYVYHYDLRGPVTPFRADIRVEICRATMSDVEEAALLPAPRDRRFNGRLDNGNACFVAKAEGASSRSTGHASARESLMAALSSSGPARSTPRLRSPRKATAAGKSTPGRLRTCSTRRRWRATATRTRWSACRTAPRGKRWTASVGVFRDESSASASAALPAS